MNAKIARLEKALASRQSDYAAAKRALANMEYSGSADAIERARQNVEWTRGDVLQATNVLEFAARRVAS